MKDRIKTIKNRKEPAYSSAASARPHQGCPLRCRLWGGPSPLHPGHCARHTAGISTNAVLGTAPLGSSEPQA